MSLKEWVLPLVLGAVAAGLVFVLPTPSFPHDDPLPAPVEEPLGLAWAFHHAVAEPGGSAPFVGVGEPTDPVLELTCENGPRRVLMHFETKVLWVAEIPVGCRSLDGVLRVDYAPSDALHFGVDGYNATDVTVMVFDEKGELLASNAGATSRNRYHLYGDFVTLSSRTWYLGDGPTPPGMRVPDGYEASAHRQLDGLPEGALAYLPVGGHEYDWLVGPIWITVHVESVTHAP